MTTPFEGASFARGEAGYEGARRSTLANGHLPERRPELILRAAGEEDIVAALGLARERGWKVAVRSGGHSWVGSHLRDGGLLLDLGGMRAVQIDAETGTTTAEPGKRSSELAVELAAHDLFFPTGHCPGPCLGGYLLQGGFGWDSRRLGPGCVSVRALDVVTAAGERMRIDADSHSDLYWAARGAGPGFFAVVTRFHLDLHPRPKVQLASSYTFPIDGLEELMRWAHGASAAVPESIEMMIFMRRGFLGDEEPALRLLAPVLADSEEEAIADLALVESCPLLDRAAQAETRVRTDVAELVADAGVTFYPEGRRYAADNMWTGAPVEELLPHYRRIAETLPAAPSHMMWMNWAPGEAERPEMAYSVEDDVYVALYGIWEKPEDDPRFEAWAVERMREMEPAASGIQLADENLAQRPARFLADANRERLERVRATYDPDALFHTYMSPA